MDSNVVWSNVKHEVEFLKQYPMLSQATADNTSPIPGYLFGEINALTYINNGMNSKQLVGYFISKLNSESPAVKTKVLKLLLYLAQNGHKNVTEEVKNNEVVFKKAAAASGAADNLQDKSFYENIRKLAKELLEIIFSEDHISKISSNTYPSEDAQKMTGYGSSASTKKLLGFGNTANNSKTVGEQIVEGLSNFVGKILSPDSEDERHKTQTAFLSQSLPQYKPIIVEKSESQDLLLSSTSENVHPPTIFPAQPIISKAMKKSHVAGKAGGGWDETDDEEEDSDKKDTLHKDSPNRSVISVDSLDNKSELPACPEWIDEHKVVNDFAVDEPLEALKWGDISVACKSCSALNCDKLIEFLVEKLSLKEENSKLRALIFMECLLHYDVITIEPLIRIALPNLKEQSLSPESPVQFKSKKICLIIDSLSNCHQHSNVKPRIASPMWPLKS